MLSGMKDMTGPICRARNLFLYTKNIITYLFILQMRKKFYAEDKTKMIRELNLFVLWEIGFLARQIGHGSTMRSRLS